MKKSLIALLVISLFLALSCPAPTSQSENDIKGSTQIITDKDILIMVYLDADNNLEPYALEDINEMESVNLQNTGIKIIALVDRIDKYTTADGDWTNTRLYEIKYDSNGNNSTMISTRIAGMGLTVDGNEELNMGNPATLSSFIDFCKSNYQADDYVLDLWNHGGGWRSIEEKPVTKAVCWDDTSYNDCLYMAELKSAVSGKGLSLIGFDACYMGMVEVAYELRNCAQIMVASEETEPGDGWNYVALLNKYIFSNLSMSALADSIVESYGEFYKNSVATMSAIDLSQMESLSTALTNFADYLTGIESSAVITARANTLCFSEEDNVDLYDFVNKFDSTQAAALKTVISNCVIKNWVNSSIGSNGLAIYFPACSINYNYSTAVELSTNCSWIDFLNDFINY